MFGVDCLFWYPLTYLWFFVQLSQWTDEHFGELHKAAVGAEPPFMPSEELQHAPVCYLRDALLDNSGGSDASSRLVCAARVHGVVRKSWKNVNAPARVPTARMCLTSASTVERGTCGSASGTVMHGLSGAPGSPFLDMLVSSIA